MRLGFLGLAANFVLNILFYRLMGFAGPALATLLVSLGLGITILHFSAKELHTSIRGLFDCKYLLTFALECIGGTAAFSAARRWLETTQMHYLAVMIAVCAGYALCVGLPNAKRFLHDLKKISTLKA